MSHATIHVLLYAVAAAASPLVLTATFLVIRSDRPGTNGIAFLSGFLLGTVLACGVGLLLGQAAADHLDAHDTVEGVLTLALAGAVVISLAREGAKQEPPVPNTPDPSNAHA